MWLYDHKLKLKNGININMICQIHYTHACTYNIIYNVNTLTFLLPVKKKGK